MTSSVDETAGPTVVEPPPTPQRAGPRGHRAGRRLLFGGHALLLLAVLAFSWVFLRTAWVSDDARITFRSVEQLHAGHGPRWNPHDRVQAFTHPLWFLLLAVTRWVSADGYLNAVVLSWLLGVAAIAASRRLFDDPRRWLLAWALLLCSRSFVDYTSSGLENPLVFALLTALLLLLERERLALATLVMAALLLCRHDLALLAGPPFLALLLPRLRAAPRRTLAAAAAGGTPFFAWTAFAIVYYGFPFPNTAYAKLAGGIPASELWRQGLAYVGNLVRWDPLAAAVIVAGTVAALRQPSRWRWWGLGMAAYVGYVVHIGGDFMAGRFFTPVLLVAAYAVAASLPWQRWALPVAGLLLVYALVLPGSPWRSGADYRALYDFRHKVESGITDERGYYFKAASLWGHLAGVDRTMPPLAQQVSVAGAVGATGMQAGVDQVVVDENALGDPLLARLPAESPWRIGHFRRKLPAGYLESLRTGENRIRNPYVRALYDDVRSVTQGPLWTAERWRAVARLNLRPPRFPCAEPPCRELVVVALPASAYAPRLWQQGGSVDRVWASGDTVRAAGRLPFAELEPEQQVIVALPVAPVASAVAKPEGWPSGAFLVDLRFASAEQAARAASELCIAAGTAAAETVLLASDRPLCRRLLAPVTP